MNGKLHKIWLILPLFMTVIMANGQNNDSLLYEATITANKNKKIDLYTKLSINYKDSDEERAFEYFNTAMFLCDKFGMEEKSLAVMKTIIKEFSSHTDLMMKMLGSREQVIDQSFHYKKVGELYFQASSAFFDNNDLEMATLYSLKSRNASMLASDTSMILNNVVNLGYCYGMLGDVQMAIEYFVEAEDLTIAVNDYRGLIDIYMNLGGAYMEMDSTDRSLDYYFKALKYSVQYDDTVSRILYFNVSNTYFACHKYDEALAYCKKALESYFVEDDPRFMLDADIYMAMSEIYVQKGEIKQATECLQNSITQYNEVGNAEGEVIALCYQGNLYASLGNGVKANQCYQRAIGLFGSGVSDKQQNLVYLGLAKFNSQNGNYKLSYEYLDKAYQITDSTLGDERQQTQKALSQQIKVKEDIMQAEQQLRISKRQQLAENAQQESRRRMLVFVIIAVALVATFVIILLMHVRKTNLLLKKANLEISIQKDQLETANKRAQRRYEFLDLLISSMPAPFLYMDSKGVLVGCNTAFEEASGKPRKELIGFNINDIHDQTGFGWDYDYGKNYDFNNIGKMNFADGKVHDVMCHVSTLHDDGAYGKLTCMLIVDVTELENVRRELCESQKRLEDALNVKTKFFSIFAHDLKNPFNGILGLTNLLSECYENYSSEDVQKYLQVINDSANNIYHLLTNLLDWAKSQTGMLDVCLSNFVINETINEAIALNDHILAQKNIEVDLRFEDVISVVADKNMILTVARNLLGNAIKYTPNGGRITFNVVNEGHDKVLVSITDSGIGMSQETIDRLFNVDHPISTPGLNNEKGAGLGLIICHQFIKQNGGDIAVVSEVGKGTTFSFILNKA